MADGSRGGQPLALVGLAGEEPGKSFGEHVLAHVVRRRRLSACRSAATWRSSRQ